MTRRRSPGCYRRIGLVGTSCIVRRLHPGFDDDASWTTRRIPVIVLEPVAAAGAA